MLAKLIERARLVVMTEAERRAQAVSFAYGNLVYGEPAVTKEFVEEVAAKLYDRRDA